MLNWASSTYQFNRMYWSDHVLMESNTFNNQLSPPTSHEVRTLNLTCENSWGEWYASRSVVPVKRPRPRLANSMVTVGLHVCRFWVQQLIRCRFCFFQFVLHHECFIGISIWFTVLDVLSFEKHRGLGFVDWYSKSHVTPPGSSLGVSTNLTPVYDWLSGCPVRHGDRWTQTTDLAVSVCWHPKHNQIRPGSRRSTFPSPPTTLITCTHRHFGGVAGASRITDRGAPPEKLGMSRPRPEMDLRLVYQDHWVPVSNNFSRASVAWSKTS